MTDVVYLLTNEDVQNVAEQELGHKLSEEEVALLVDQIADNIPWYEAIADAITEIIDEEA